MGQSEKIPDHILVIRLSAMGDVAMTVPVLKSLINQYPEIKITVLTKAFFKPLFSPLPNVVVMVADIHGKHKGVLGLWRLYKDLLGLRITLVADLHNVLRSNILKQFFRFGNIPFHQIEKGRAEKKSLTSNQAKAFRPLKTTHHRYAQVFSTLGLPIEFSAASFLAKEKITENILQIVGEKNLPWLGIAPFAAFKGKMYPLPIMEKVIAELNNTKRYKILCFGGGPTEKSRLDSLVAHYSNCLNIAGELTFEEELALISNLDLMISMDSGNGHLAANYRVPVITLWGVTHPYAGFAPFGQDRSNSLLADRNRFPLIPTSVYGNKMPRGYERAIETIGPGEIVQKVIDILQTK